LAEEGKAYAELHCHSHWSLLDGASSIEELVLRAREIGYEALAITDHDGLHGAMEFAQTAWAFGLRPIIGAEVTLANGYHLTLLCETQEGYANLCRLLSHAHLNSPRGQPALDPTVLARHARGLIALSGCKKGEVPSLVAGGRYREAEAAARRYSRIFGRDSFFIELQQNLAYGDTTRIRALADLAKRLNPSTGSGQGVGYVATNNVHYHLRERHRLQDVLVAIKNRTTLDASHTLRRENSEYYLKSPQEMARLFAEWPEALETSVRIAERCRFDLTRDLDYRFPDYPVPALSGVEGPEAETAASYLEKLCYEAARERYDCIAPEVEARLREELALVRKHGLSGFFLIYRDLLELARQVAEEVRGKDSARSRAGLPPGRGRGSSVGSLICYLIGLSHIDPLQHRLFLSRFLNEEMTSVPDIDLDFPRGRFGRSSSCGSTTGSARSTPPWCALSPPTRFEAPCVMSARPWVCRRRSWTSWPSAARGAEPATWPRRWPACRSSATR
jgi:error-prone DNA polymerase